MFTENLHLEQERTKFSYHDRHKLIVLFAPFFPRLARASNTMVCGMEVDAGDTASVVCRMGPGPFLPGAAVLSQRAEARFAIRYIGVPQTRSLFGVNNLVCSQEHVSLFCWGENAGCRLNSGWERGEAGTRNISRRWAGTTAVHRTVIIAGKNQQLIGNNTNSWHCYQNSWNITRRIFSRPGRARGCSINSLVSNLAIWSQQPHCLSTYMKD